MSNFLYSSINSMPLLLSFSGGQDSTILLLSTLKLKPTVVHFNHLIQKTNFLNCNHYFRLHYFFKLNHHFGITLKYIQTEFLGTLWRYHCFERLCLLYQYNQVLLGKTKTDFYENFFIAFLRNNPLLQYTKKTLKYYFSSYSFLF